MMDFLMPIVSISWVIHLIFIKTPRLPSFTLHNLVNYLKD